MYCRKNVIVSYSMEQVDNDHIVVSPLCREPGNILDGKSCRQGKATAQTNCVCRFQCEDKNVYLVLVQRHYYRVRPVEPCHRLGEVTLRSS